MTNIQCDFNKSIQATQAQPNIFPQSVRIPSGVKLTRAVFEKMIPAMLTLSIEQRVAATNDLKGNASLYFDFWSLYATTVIKPQFNDALKIYNPDEKLNHVIELFKQIAELCTQISNDDQSGHLHLNMLSCFILALNTVYNDYMVSSSNYSPYISVPPRSSFSETYNALQAYPGAQELFSFFMGAEIKGTPKDLKSFLSQNPAIRQLKIQRKHGDNNNSDIVQISTMLQENTNLRGFTLSFGTIDYEKATTLANALLNTSITTFALYCNNLEDDGTTVLAKALTNNTSLTSLDLSSNKIGEKGTKALADALIENTSIRLLNLSGNPIRHQGASILGEVLNTNHFLTSLILCGTHIKQEGTEALAKALTENTNLTSIDLSRNRIGKKGIVALSDALQKNRSIKSLILRSCKIGDDAAIPLAIALQINKSITTLCLMDNFININAGVAFGEALKNNNTLTNLSLSSNFIKNQGTITIATSLQTNTSLSSLNLWGNSIRNNGAAALADALQTNTSLRSLSVGGNQEITGEPQQRLIQLRSDTRKIEI